MSQQFKNGTASLLKNYDRRDGTDNLGGDFETKITALMALRSISLEDSEDMWIGSNMDHVGDFDDIVLYRRTTDGRRLAYMLQLHHQARATEITVREFIDNKIKKKHFSISKYSESYVSLKTKLDCLPAIEVIQYLREVDDMVFIIFTNRGVAVSECDFLKQCCDNTMHFLDTSCTKDKCFQFCQNDFELPKNFVLLANQSHVHGVTSLIKQEINNLLGASFKLSNAVSNKTVKKFVEFIKTWAMGSKVDDSKIYFTLTKSDIIGKLTDILVHNYKYDFLHKSTNYFQKRRKYGASESCLNGFRRKSVWNQLTDEKNITIVDSGDSVDQFLIQNIGDEVGNYLREGFEKSWGEELSAVTLQSLLETHEDIAMNLVKMNGNYQNLTMLDLYNSLWFINKTPLLLKSKKVQDYNFIMAIFKLSNNNLHVIVVKNECLKVELKTVGATKHFLTLDDLNTQHRDIILNQPIKLQNRPNHMLTNLLDASMYRLVTCRDIIEILQGNFNVGNHYGPLTNFHLERMLSRVFLKLDVFNKINEEVFVLKYIKKEKRPLGEFVFPDNVIVEGSDNLDYVNQGKVVHEVILQDNDKLEWKRSFGTTKNIIKYVLEEENLQSNNWVSLLNEKEYFFNCTHVITADPGMGKSTFTDFMALHAPANVWVVKIVLNKYEEHYKNIQNNSAHDHLNFFADQLIATCGNLKLCKAIFQKCLLAKQVLVILDGFDEIVMEHEEEVMKLAKCLHNEGFPLWLTTRPNKKHELEEAFCTIAQTLNPLTQNDQRKFLTKYFSQKCDFRALNQQSLSNTIERFVEELFEVVDKNFNDDFTFMEIPLHAELLADAFSVDFERLLETGEINLCKTFSIVHLYENFISRKVDILCEKFGSDAKRSRKYIENHQKLFALKYLYSEERVKYLKINEQLNEYYSGEGFKILFLQREGIVVVKQESSGEKQHYNINFTHRTFAEFLTAQWLADNVSNQDCRIKRFVKDVIVTEQGLVVDELFNLILAQNCPLHIAVLTRNFQEAEKILEVDPARTTDIDKAGRTILHIIAIKWNDEDENWLESLLKKISGVNIENTRDLVRNFTALDYALLGNFVDIDEYSLANCMCQAFPNLTISSTKNPKKMFFSYCAVNNAKELFAAGLRYYVSKDLLLRHVDKNTTVVSYCTACNVKLDNHRLVNNYIGDFGITTVLELFQFKVKQNDQLIGHYFYELNIACAFGTKDNVNYLLAKGSTINSPHFDKTALHYAAHHDRLEIVTTLLDKGAIIDKPDEDGRTALHWTSSADVVNLLLSAGADIEKCDNNGATPLNVALMKGNLDSALKLLSKGANVNLDNSSGYSPFHYAAQYGCADIIFELLAKGVCVNKRDKYGDTPLNWAIREGNIETARLLLSKGANGNLNNYSGYSPLHFAARNGFTDIIPDLLATGICVNIQNKDGDTPLHFAVNKVRTDTTEYLLKANADVNLQNGKGQTPLHVGVIHKFYSTDDTPLDNRISVVRLLLNKGADINIRDKEGYTSLQYADRRNSYRKSFEADSYLQFQLEAKMILLRQNRDTNTRKS